MDRFVSKHPEYRQRIMPTVPPHIKTDNTDTNEKN